jgi:hypothetical protein
MLILGSASLHGANPGSVSGVVRDSSGAPQMGAKVELLRPDLSVAAAVYTNAGGEFLIAPVVPGRYALKAMGTSFLPSLREDVRVRSKTVVNLTLNTLYEVMQWLPSQPRAGNAQNDDDWAWTLRSAANRPLLRWLEDGPLVVVSDESGRAPRLKARLVATGSEGSFGESGERIEAAILDTPSDSRELLAQVEFEPNSPGELESRLGFRQDLGYTGAVQTVAEVALHPAESAGISEGLDEAAIQTWETLQFGDSLTAEAGAMQTMARWANGAGRTALASLPFASVALRNGDSTYHYSLATALAGRASAVSATNETAMPAISVRNGRIAIEHGLHQEFGWERKTERTAMSVLVYSDRIENPVLEGSVRPANSVNGTPVTSAWLFDSQSGLMHVAGPAFSETGLMAAVDARLPSGNQIRLTYANGSALALNPGPRVADLAQLLAAAHPRRAQTYSISLSGTLEGSGTRWRATYRWQPDDTLTPVAGFAQNAAEPYLNLHLRQPIHISREGLTSFDALVDVRNLLGQGYRPYLLSDGSLLLFAEDQRGLNAGISFNF